MAVVTAASACRSQVRAKSSVDGLSGSDADASDRMYELPESKTDPTAARVAAAAPRPRALPAPAAAVVDRPVFLGVVHDLTLASGAPRTATCNCLAVAFGSPNDPKFVWQADAPAFDGETMAVAIAADGVACASPGAAPLRASISAVEREGYDIVVVVENAREGQPVMRGALATSPGPNGALVIRGRNGAPYGAPASGGAGPCRIALK